MNLIKKVLFRMCFRFGNSTFINNIYIFIIDVELTDPMCNDILVNSDIPTGGQRGDALVFFQLQLQISPKPSAIFLFVPPLKLLLNSTSFWQNVLQQRELMAYGITGLGAMRTNMLCRKCPHWSENKNQDLLLLSGRRLLWSILRWPCTKKECKKVLFCPPRNENLEVSSQVGSFKSKLDFRIQVRRYPSPLKMPNLHLGED